MSSSELSPVVGAMSTPDSAAKTVPMIHDDRRTAIGLVPVMFTRSGLSTTARIATPDRAYRKNRYSRIVATSATPIVIAWS